MDFEGGAWDDNFVQFTRLLAEIRAVGLTYEQRMDIAKSMDVDVHDVDHLLDRAECEFEMRVKKNKEPRHITLRDELEEWERQKK